MTEPDAASLLAWYDTHQRRLPWRTPAPDPYHVWVSEIMLQQTTVATVTARFVRFLGRFPDVGTLAAAPEAAVLEEWAGLGYYARARNLHACAKALAARGSFPRTVAGLLALPGVGTYTARAIAAIAFREPVVPVDGNVERVACRLLRLETPAAQARGPIDALAEAWMAQPAARARPGDFAQALFDLGATLCTPKRPACALCPWSVPCRARAAGVAEALPIKSPRRERPLRYGVHFLGLDGDGRMLLRRRPPSGLLGGMLEPAGTPWRPEPWSDTEAMAFAPLTAAAWRRVPGLVTHQFTHFRLELGLLVAETAATPPPKGMEWLPPATAMAGFPTVMRKLVALHHGTPAAPLPSNGR